MTSRRFCLGVSACPRRPALPVPAFFRLDASKSAPSFSFQPLVPRTRRRRRWAPRPEKRRARLSWRREFEEPGGLAALWRSARPAAAAREHERIAARRLREVCRARGGGGRRGARRAVGGRAALLGVGGGADGGGAGVGRTGGGVFEGAGGSSHTDLIFDIHGPEGRESLTLDRFDPERLSISAFWRAAEEADARRVGRGAAGLEPCPTRAHIPTLTSSGPRSDPPIAAGSCSLLRHLPRYARRAGRAC